MASIDSGLKATAERFLSAARCAHPSYWFGPRKVFLAAILDRTDPEVLAAQLEALDECRRAQLIRFARADLVAAMDTAIVAESEWVIPGATYHFVELG